jgi:hypothetical protein
MSTSCPDYGLWSPFTGVRRVRQHGDGDGRRQRQHLIFGLWTIAEIINNDGEFAGKRWRSQSQRTGYGKSNCDEIEAKLIFPTTAVD